MRARLLYHVYRAVTEGAIPREFRAADVAAYTGDKRSLVASAVSVAFRDGELRRVGKSGREWVYRLAVEPPVPASIGSTTAEPVAEPPGAARRADLPAPDDVPGTVGPVADDPGGTAVDDAAATFARELRRFIVRAVRAEIDGFADRFAREFRRDVEPPAPVVDVEPPRITSEPPTPTERLPKVLVVGPIGSQAAVLRERFPGLDLRFGSKDSSDTKPLTRTARTADASLVWLTFAGHAHDSAVKSVARAYYPVKGGLTAVIDKLAEIERNHRTGDRR